MRFFEARPLLHEIGCALGKAHNVFHLKGVLRRPLETTRLIVMWEPVSENPVYQAEPRPLFPFRTVNEQEYNEPC